MSIRQRLLVTYPALASRNFFIFWVGMFVSLIGTWMQNTTQPYLAYRLSGKPFDLGLIGFASALPMLFLALPGGVLVERLDKVKTVIAMQVVMLVQALLLAFLTFTGLIQIWHIVVLSFLLGMASAIEVTARQSMLIELVGKEALPNAIALQSTIMNAARVLGPSLVAPFLILINGKGEGWAFLVNAISYLAIIISLFFVKTPFKTAKVFEERNYLQDFKEGQSYILKTRMIGMIILMVAVLSVIAFPLTQQIPVIASDVLRQVGDSDATRGARNSLLYSAQGVGALVAAFTLASYNARHKGRWMVAGQAVFIGGMILIYFSRSLSFEAIILALIGWGSVTMLANMNMLVQLEVPDELRGRVFGAYIWGMQGIAPFGALLIGWMTQVWGVPLVALTCGLVSLVVIAWIQLSSREIWNATS